MNAVDGGPVDTGELVPDRLPEPASAIVFAQEFGCPKILPSTFYRLLQISFKADWSFCESKSSEPIFEEYAQVRS